LFNADAFVKVQSWLTRSGWPVFVVAAVLSMLLAGTALAQSTEPEPKAGDGKPNYGLLIDAPAELIGQIRAETLLGRWQFRTEFSPDQLDALVFRAKEEIEVVLRGQGYFDFEVEVKRLPDNAGRAVVKADVSAGARTTVNDLSFKVKGAAASDADFMAKLQQAWPLPEGGFYRSLVWEQAKKNTLDLLQQQGYLGATLTSSQVTVDVRNTTAGVKLEFESGPRYRFGEIKVTGLSRYEQSIVDSLRGFRAGDFYRLDALIEFQTKLRDSGYFTSVSIVPEISEILGNADAASATAAASLWVPVAVELKERESKRVLGGVGFSADQGPRAQLGFENRNLFSKGYQLDSGILVERVRTRLFATVRTPLSEEGRYYALGSRSEKFELLGEEAFKNTIFLQRGRRTTNIDSVSSVQYQAERLLIDRGAGVQVGDKRAALTLAYSWNYRRIDSRIDPREGYTVSSQATLASKSLGSDQTFIRLYTRAMNFYPLPQSVFPKGATLVSLLELGIVSADSRQGIPSDNLFRAGGAQSLRGYRYLSLGAADGAAVVGGRYLAIGSLEYQQPVYKNILGAVFIDAGDATDDTDNYKAKIGAGMGMRWRSPIGPVNIDAAYGAFDKRWRLHFSVGYSF
jgi:translocation and assembly module TamA